MTEITGFPWAMNQPVPEGSGYAAEALRSQHYDSTAGGNGVGAPGALKVHAQTAADGTVRTTPGGVTFKSPYAGHVGQSYHSYFGVPVTLPVSPTGSSAGGRTDLVIAQICDPEHENHWSYSGDYPIPADVAATMDFQRIHVLEGQNRSASLAFPHVKLAEIKRPANKTVVTGDDITDLRELANPKTFRAKYDQMVGERTEVPRTGTWRVLAEVPVEVPEWATHAAIDVSIGGAYFRGASGRGAFGMTGLGNTSAIGHTPWWEEGGDATGFRRIPYMQAGRKLNVQPQYRGKTSTIYIQGRVDSWSDTNFVFGADAGARAFVDVDWIQDTE